MQDAEEIKKEIESGGTISAGSTKEKASLLESIDQHL